MPTLQPPARLAGGCAKLSGRKSLTGGIPLEERHLLDDVPASPPLQPSPFAAPLVPAADSLTSLCSPRPKLGSPGQGVALRGAVQRLHRASGFPRGVLRQWHAARAAGRAGASGRPLGDQFMQLVRERTLSASSAAPGSAGDAGAQRPPALPHAGSGGTVRSNLAIVGTPTPGRGGREGVVQFVLPTIERPARPAAAPSHYVFVLDVSGEALGLCSRLLGLAGHRLSPRRMAGRPAAHAARCLRAPVRLQSRAPLPPQGPWGPSTSGASRTARASRWRSPTWCGDRAE